MFQLTRQEAENWMSQIATSNKERMGLRKMPYAFTEQGVAMLSSVVNSDRAIEVNIQIMRVFVIIKEMMVSHKDLARRIEDLEQKFGDHDKKIMSIFEAIRQLLREKEEPPKAKIPFGFLCASVCVKGAVERDIMAITGHKDRIYVHATSAGTKQVLNSSKIF